MKAIVVSIGLVLLVACGPAPLPAPPPLESPFVSRLPTLAPTGLPPTSVPFQSPVASPGPISVPYQPFAEPVMDCQMFPALADCRQPKVSLKGRLAVYNSQAQQLSVLDLAQRSGWQISQAVLTMDWSPSGDYLLVRDPQLAYTVYQSDGTLIGHYSSVRNDSLSQLAWAVGDTLNFDSFAIVSATGAKAWIDKPTTQLSRQQHITIQLSPLVAQITPWPIPETGDIHELIAWVPHTQVLLADYFYSGNAVWVIGGSLYSLDALTGKTIDLHQTMLRGGAYDWHPTQPGLMVFSSTYTPNMGGQRLALLNVLTGELHYLLSDKIGALTPSWSPDGKFIVFSALIRSSSESHDPAFSSPGIYIIDPVTGKTRALTQPAKELVDSLPRWSADGKYLFYVRDDQGRGHVEIRVTTLDGSVDQAIVTNLPPIHCFFNDYTCFAKGLAAYWPF